MSLIDRFARYLPALGPAVSLGEGGTPLVRADRFAAAVSARCDLWLKIEGQNPTGSFKDRGMCVAVTAARDRGVRVIVCASTGNTAASAAAYAARAGLGCTVVLPAGAVAAGKLAQAVAHGAKVVQVRGTFDTALAIVRQLGDTDGFEVVNSTNPLRIEGQKTAAFEVCEELGSAPDAHLLPYGNAGNLTAYWRGYREFGAGLPRMIGCRAANPGTVASAIRIANPASRSAAESAVGESGGALVSVDDGAILDARATLARTEGIFCEAASAAGLAALPSLGLHGTVVVTLTGHGLKDAPAVDVDCATVDADLDAVERAIVA